MITLVAAEIELAWEVEESHKMKTVRYRRYAQVTKRKFCSTWELLPEIETIQDAGKHFADAFNEFDFHSYFGTREVSAARQAYVANRDCLLMLLAVGSREAALTLLEELNPRSPRKFYAYALGSLWSSQIALEYSQWTALIERHTQRRNALLKSISEPETQRSRFIEVRVRREVWVRDSGRCVECGSKDLLEFDHIIPVALGGSNTARNIQLLCENCNREKSATLG